jgi:hypothetical protein
VRLTVECGDHAIGFENVVTGHSVRVRLVATGLVALSAVVLAGCGASSEEQQVSAAAAQFVAAAGRGDARSACALLTPRTRNDLVTSQGEDCTQALPVDRIRGGVGDAVVWSDWARVGTDSGALFLTRFDSGWLVDAAGCQPDGDAPYRCVVGG